MTASEFLTAMKHPFKPRTPNAALKAVLKNILPPESFIYRAASVIPLHAENISLEELDRILGQPDRNLITNLFLIGILEVLLDHPDPETALYAAESISLIENSYNIEIVKVKRNRNYLDSPDSLLKLSGLYHDLARINGSNRTIRSFYLKESFQLLRKKEILEPLTRDESKTMVRILIDLGQYYQARNIVQNFSDDPEMLILEAETEFSVGNYTGVAKICTRLQSRKVFLDLEELKLLDFWTRHGQN